MKKSEKNIFKFLLLILIFFILFLIIRNTYSKYITTKDSSTKSNISKWNILINDKNIAENKNFSELIELKIEKNKNATENVIVPTSKAYIEFSLESTGTELPFEYELSILDNPELQNPVTDFRITSYSLNGKEIVELGANETSLKGTVIPPKDADGNFTGEKVKNDFILYLEWYDGNNNNLDNANDVAVSKLDNPTGYVNLNLKVSQIINIP